MKILLALVLALMTRVAYAIMVESRDQVPRDRSEISRIYDDSISTGQSSTSRTVNDADTSAKKVRPVLRCVDKNGFAYYRTDSGYAACVNQSSSYMQSR